ncbi:MAG: DUF2868 domain-containing protein [Desulfobulbaceae bacterium]|nr:DUF2868 domain-containing protein [Desulfobulbaceae bacterium]
MGFAQVKKWRIRDIIDLEYFFYQDTLSQSAENKHSLQERDRKIFLDSVMPAVKKDESPDRQFIIKTWLNRRREAGKKQTAILPGEGVESLFATLRFIFLMAGLVFGAGSGASFLSYTGASPVNVLVYLSVFVIFQLFLLLLLFVLSTYRLYRRSPLVSSPLYLLISRFMLRMLLSARNRVAKKMSADQRLQLESVFGAMVSKTRSYGMLFFLPVFLVTQLFALGCNLGLLSATLFKVVTADIAFGWQSTIQLSPAALHALVQKIALPWSWAVPGDAAFPTLAQIEGSRIILKEGIYHLSTPNLVSWWPFLCLAVLFYGLLPRLVLFLGAAYAQRKYLGSLDFRQGNFEQLLQRMTTPVVTTRGKTADDAGEAAKEPEPAPLTPEQSAAEGKITAGKNLLVMIPDEIYDACSPEEIQSVVDRGSTYAIEEIIRINQDYAADRQLLAGMGNRPRMGQTDILIIQEAWQPPIMEYTDFIKQLRQAVGHGPCIRIGLIGKPRPETVFTPVKDENMKIWTQKITAMGDPGIYVEGLVTHAA